MASLGAPAALTGLPLCIDGEVSLERRGFVHVQIDLERRLVHWKDSNQWNNNFVRALSVRQIQQIYDWFNNWPEEYCYDAVSGDPMQWRVNIRGEEGDVLYCGRNSRDTVWTHWKNLLRQTKIR
jgi:hypothetical protein